MCFFIHVVPITTTLMKVESIGAFCHTCNLYKAIIGLENQLLVFFFEWPLKTGFTVFVCLVLSFHSAQVPLTFFVFSHVYENVYLYKKNQDRPAAPWVNQYREL